ncbi:MAG: ADP-ribosylglycohydrolase family protein [Anaerolineae bacterium]|nr:ADP-ribosylglycohydrolase family protein [Anaerolineae bacterium]
MTGNSLQASLLYKKVYGCMLGGAIGDALGGPVELWTTEKIRETYGNLDRFVPYDRAPSHHGQFRSESGVYTDDTRLKHLLCQAIFNAGGKPRPGDVGHLLAQAYHSAPDDLHQGFVEEYYLKAIWGRDKVIFSGEPTNGAIMANSPLGLICACRPDEAYQLGFDLAFFTDGHAKTAAAMLVAAIAEAMRPNAAVDSIIEAARTAHLRFARRREGDHWHHTPWRYDPNLKFLDQALEIARRERDVFAIREPLMNLLEWGHLFSESVHTLVVALSMFVAADGDLRQSIIGAVMYGRDKDSYASVVGALAGAFHGADAIPPEWSQPVLAANPDPDMQTYALRLTELIAADYRQLQANLTDLGALI